MVARFGVRRSGPRVETGVCAAAMVLAAAGCSGDALLVGEERPPPGSGADDAETPGDIDPAAAPSDLVLTSDCPPSAEERQALLGCWPTRHLGIWRGFFTGIPRHETADGAGAEFPRGDVQLVLGSDARAQLTFGAGSLGAPANDPPVPVCAPSDDAPGCPRPGLLIPGFAYSLGELELLDPDPQLAPLPRIAGEPAPELAESMRFVVHVREPWDIWCSTQGPEQELGCSGGDCVAGDWLPARGAPVDPPPGTAADRRGCRCDANGCQADAPSLALSIGLWMSRDGRALRGSYRPNDASLGEARLELRKAER